MILPELTTSIGSRAFADCGNLARIYIPKSVTEISSDAFEGVKGLEIFGTPNSAAHICAQQNGFRFYEHFFYDVIRILTQ